MPTHIRLELNHCYSGYWTKVIQNKTSFINVIHATIVLPDHVNFRQETLGCALMMSSYMNFLHVIISYSVG